MFATWVRSTIILSSIVGMGIVWLGCVTSNHKDVGHHEHHRLGSPPDLTRGTSGNTKSIGEESRSDMSSKVDGRKPLDAGANGLLTALCPIAQAPEGSEPASLIQGRDGNLYGQLSQGGSFGMGCIYKCSPAGAFKVLHSFNGADGAHPIGRLCEGGDGLFYGATMDGGELGFGVVFSMKPSGAFTMCFSFPDSVNHVRPSSGVVRTPDGSLYGEQDNNHMQQARSRGETGPRRIYCLSSLGSLRIVDDYEGLPANSLAVGDDGVVYGLRTEIVIVNPDRMPTRYPTMSSPPQPMPPILYETAQVIRYAHGATPEVILKLPDRCYPYSDLMTDHDGVIYGLAAGGSQTRDDRPLHCWVYRISHGAISIVKHSYTQSTRMPNAVVAADRGSVYFSAGMGIFKLAPSGAITEMNAPGSPLYRPIQLWQSPLRFAASGGRVFGIYVSENNPGGEIIRMEPAGGWSSIHRFKPVTDLGSATSGVVQGPDGALYGATTGAPDTIIFRWTEKDGLSILHRFHVASDGEDVGGLTFASNGSLWGTTRDGGPDHGGTVFRITTRGDFKVIYTFHYNDGKWPCGRLTVGPDGNLYGTTSAGGAQNAGTVFRLTRTGQFTALQSIPYTKEEWASAFGDDKWLYGLRSRSLVLGRDGWLYGVAPPILYRVSTAGEFERVHSFPGNLDPESFTDLTLSSDGSLYGASDWLAYKITPGGNYVVLRDEKDPGFGVYSRIKCEPNGFVEARDGYLYQVVFRAESSSTWDLGHIRRMSRNGDVCDICDFGVGNEGRYSQGGLILAADGNLYGTARSTDGAGGNGGIFRFTPPKADSFKDAPP